jgi:3-hydroxymyristoyl/3-hydroxydecanoyl-(acyl carrier protein) dehydratase
MLRRLRYKRWFVAGLAVAALAVPATASAGNDLGAKDSWYGYAVSVTTQSRQLSRIDPAIVKYLRRYGFTTSQIVAYSQPLQPGDVLAAQLKMDPAKVGYLLRYGFTPSQIVAYSKPVQPGEALAAQLKMDPARVGYLLRYGFTPSQIVAYSKPVQPGDVLAAQLKMDPARVGYLLRYGFTPSQIAKFSIPLGSKNAPNENTVTSIVRDPGFQWDDFGVGLSAALLALSVLAAARLLSNRGGQRPITG